MSQTLGVHVSRVNWLVGVVSKSFDYHFSRTKIVTVVVRC